LCKMQKQSS